jgi:hypothetical protein
VNCQPPWKPKWKSWSNSKRYPEGTGYLRSLLLRSKEKEWSDLRSASSDFFAYFRIPNAIFLNRRLIYDFLKKFLNREGNNSILHVGCGGGDVLTYLASRLEKNGFRFSLTGVDAMHRQDGPLSVLRSYADEEIGRFVGEAGVRSFRIHSIFPRKFIIIRTSGE